MKLVLQHIVFLFAICTLLVSCREEESDFAVLSGRLNDVSVDSIYVKAQRISKSDDVYVIPLVGSTKKNFRDTLEAEKGYYNLEIDKDFPRTLYLEPNFNLEMDISGDSISFKGVGEKENNYLAKKRQLLNEIRHITVYTYYPTLEENRFLEVLDSISQLQLNILAESNIDNLDFVELEKKSILMLKVHNLLGYEVGRRLLTDTKDFEVSEKFPKVADLIDFDDARFLDVTFFPVTLALSDYYFLKDSLNFDTSSTRLKCPDCDPHFETLAFMGKFLKNQEVRDEVCYVLAKWRMSQTKVLDRFYETYKKIVKNQEYLNDIEKLYANLKESKGSHFLAYTSLKGKDGNEIKLKEFRGKHVYIDLWASYCKPCIEEFSDFNRLVKELDKEHIQFVGINISDTKERWLQMADKNLGFLDSLGISGIPRYMVLDKKGQMVDYNAKRPSDLDIREELLEFISK